MKESYTNSESAFLASSASASHEKGDSQRANPLVLQDSPEDDDEPPIRPSTKSSQQIEQSHQIHTNHAVKDKSSGFHASSVQHATQSTLVVEKRPFDRDTAELAQYLHTSLSSGLDESEAQARLKHYGKNILKGQGKVTVWAVLWRQVSNAMTVILLGALAIAFATEDYAEGGVIAGTTSPFFSDFILFLMIAIVAANVGIGFFQEYRAERTMESLRKLSSPTATVIRTHSGVSNVVSIPTSDITIGDLVELRTGQVVPADLRLFNTSNLEIDESLLTGESLAVLKATDILSPADGEDAPLGDCYNLAYSGTIVTKGRGRGIVYATGMNSEIGKIAEALGGNKAKKSQPTKKSLGQRAVIVLKKVLGLYNTSPLQTKLTKLAHFLFVTAVILVIVVFATAQFNISPDVALYAISLALAIIPESLIAVVTITMAKGVTHMARRNAIVRRLDAIEALGGVTDICSDKTGTLTMGKMVVRKVWNIQGSWNCEGGDLSLTNLAMTNISSDSDNVDDILRCAALCNGAVVSKKKDKWHATGEPTEIALQIFAAKSGFSKSSVVAISEDLEKQKAGIRYIHVQEHHFDSTVKRMTVIFRDLDQGMNIAFMKGAPERVIDACLYNSQGDILTEGAKNEVLKLMDRFAGEGLRVLALASKTLKEENMSRDCVENEMHLLGLVGIYDPPKLESLPSVQECQRAGIVVHMLTGDHIATATAIAKEVGIITPSTHSRTSVITAQEFDRMTDQEIDSLSSLPLVVARCSPATKVKMVKAIHRRSRLTAMTGDGVNDSPSLKAADVGIAMGLAGSDVARQAAEIVLADDNFATIVGAVEEGRRIFDNLVKFMLHLMSSNCAEVIVLVVGLAFMDNSGKPVYPLSPVQILWENLITSAFPAFALGLEPAAHDVMHRPPHNVISGVFNKEFASDILVYGLIMGAAPLLSFVIVVYVVGNGNLGMDCNHGLNTGCDTVYRARAAVFASLTVLILLHAFEMKHSRRSIFKMNLLENKPLFISVVGGSLALFPTIYIPKVNDTVFKMTDITWEWGLCAASIIWYLIGAEGYKFLKRRFWKKDAGVVVSMGKMSPGTELSRNTTVETLK